jgi:uncharacterized protein (DUF488 family)
VTPTRIFTIGHSTRSLETFLAHLKENRIRRLADVRRFPGSRRNPHFARDSLAASLEQSGISYRHFEALGGRRSAAGSSPHTAWRVDGFRAYADHMETEAFRQALAGLMDWARELPTTVMCAEALYFKCHRQLLADALLGRGFDVVHIEGEGRSRPHALTRFARLEGERVIYDGGTLALDMPETNAPE